MRVSVVRSILVSSLTSISLAASASGLTYHVTDLGTLGWFHSEGAGVNNSGVAVGRSDANIANTPYRAFYNDGTMHGLGTFGGNQSFGTAINNSGQVVGGASTGPINHAFLYTNGVMQDLGTLGSASKRSEAYGINDSGWVVGDSGITNSTVFHAFVYHNGAMTDLGTLGGPSLSLYTNSFAYDVNNSGQVVGDSEFSAAGNSGTHAFVWQNGVMTDIGTLGGTVSRAHGINDSGQIAGSSLTAGNVFHAFSYSNGVMQDIHGLGVRSDASSINASGTVVGSWSNYSNGPTGGFVYRNGVMTDLNTLFDATSPVTNLTRATGISDTGYIIGTGYINGGEHAILLTPNAVPEPASIAALGLGALVMLRKRRRKA